MMANNVYLLENPQTMPKLIREKCEKVTNKHLSGATKKYLLKFA